MGLKILIVTDKFKGSLPADEAAAAIAKGWKAVRKGDRIRLLPMSDGGDGFGPVFGGLIGARVQKTKTMDAAHRPIVASWWWHQPSLTAIVESARVIGLAQLPPEQFHPFQLDTVGLAAVLRAASVRGAKRCFVGIGGSATNDGGFGMALGLGWDFLRSDGSAIKQWTELGNLEEILPPAREESIRGMKVIVAVDVKNRLLGAQGCSRVYGPQKGLKPEDFPAAEFALRKLARVTKGLLGNDFSIEAGAGAAGGLGFGLLAYAGSSKQSGFELFSQLSRLEQRIQQADVVITGEGALDRQTLMGKGVGEIALLCARHHVPCLGMAGVVTEPKKARKLFLSARGLVELTSVEQAKAEPARFLAQLAGEMARDFKQ